MDIIKVMMMRYELNCDEDKVIDIEAIGDNSVLDLKNCCKIMNEQQATICKLQDLCGESDGENAKLRIENKKLKAKLKEKEEDEQLYANEILELRETNKQWLEFKELGGDY